MSAGSISPENRDQLVPLTKARIGSEGGLKD
jgi:hypothetical protein